MSRPGGHERLAPSGQPTRFTGPGHRYNRLADPDYLSVRRGQFPNPDPDTSITGPQVRSVTRAVLAHLPLAVVLWFAVGGLLGRWDDVRLRAGDRRYEAISVGGYLFLQRTPVAPDGPRWQSFTEWYRPGGPSWRDHLRFEPTRRWAGFAVGTGPYEPAYELDAARSGQSVRPADREGLRGPTYAPLLLAAVPAGVYWRGRLAAAARRARPGHCPDCGYDLRGLAKPRCPECGWSLVG